MRLADLIAQTHGARLVRGNPNIEITSIIHDSREVGPGSLFVAVLGLQRDGRAFIPEAVGRGAVAVVGTDLPPVDGEAAVVEVPAARLALAQMAAAFYGHPSRHLRLVGVTGTDGKTTTTRLIATILEAAGHRSGWLTTVDVKTGDQIAPNPFSHTTPEAPAIQKVLAQMVSAGVTHVALEVSSHALALKRVEGCEFDVAVFTNLSPEHLNFHGSMEQYRSDKAILFTMLDRATQKQGRRIGVVNADDPASETMAAACSCPVITYGIHGRAPVRAEDIVVTPDGTTFTLVVNGRRLRSQCGQLPSRVQRVGLATRLVGRFNVYNWLAAISASLALGADLDAVRLACAHAGPVPGRMELVKAGQPFTVAIDFCHTPQAFQNALDTLRPLTRGRLLAVFGLPGGRDFNNRPRMGALAAEKTDFFVITTDDPYHEDPAEIARQIAVGARTTGACEGRDFIIELHRRAAFREALSRARPGDTVLLAGKGHEQRQVIAGTRLPWSEHRVAQEVLAELGFR